MVEKLHLQWQDSATMLVWTLTRFCFWSLLVDARSLLVDARSLLVESSSSLVLCRSLLVESRSCLVWCRSLLVESSSSLVLCRSPAMVDIFFSRFVRRVACRLGDELLLAWHRATKHNNRQNFILNQTWIPNYQIMSTKQSDYEYQTIRFDMACVNSVDVFIRFSVTF